MFFSIILFNFHEPTNFSSHERPFDLVFCTLAQCVGAGKSTLISISDGLDPYFFHQNMEKKRFSKEEMDGEVFISR